MAATKAKKPQDPSEPAVDKKSGERVPAGPPHEVVTGDRDEVVISKHVTESDIVKRYIGKPPQSYQQIADETGVEVEQVRAIIEKADEAGKLKKKSK